MILHMDVGQPHVQEYPMLQGDRRSFWHSRILPLRCVRGGRRQVSHGNGKIHRRANGR